MIDSVTPVKLTLKRDQGLDVTWSDGEISHYSLTYLRSMCPCATCKEVRAGGGPGPHSLFQEKKTSLTILPGNYATPLKVESVERVGNYALRLEWSDHHGSGIYSYQYLRQIMPKQ